MDLKHQQSCEGAQRENLCCGCTTPPTNPKAELCLQTWHTLGKLEIPYPARCPTANAREQIPHKHIPKDNDKKGSMHKSQILCSLTSGSDLFISHLCCHLSGGCDYQVFQLTLVGALLQFLNCNNPLLSIPSWLLDTRKEQSHLEY